MSSPVLDFVSIFVRLFVVIDPFGSLVLFVAMTGTTDTKTRRTITNDAVVYGGLILLFFAILGSYILSFFGVSIEALEIAGGLILLIMGIEMVREVFEHDTGKEAVIRNVPNPRIEAEEHYYNPEHKKLAEMGYRHSRELKEEISIMLEDLAAHRPRIEALSDVISPHTAWKASGIN